MKRIGEQCHAKIHLIINYVRINIQQAGIQHPVTPNIHEEEGEERRGRSMHLGVSSPVSRSMSIGRLSLIT